MKKYIRSENERIMREKRRMKTTMLDEKEREVKVSNCNLIKKNIKSVARHESNVKEYRKRKSS
jgi:uncharacterized protein YccT (UPF0319 family)